MDSYFASMDKLVAEKKTSSRLRFLMQVRIGFIGKVKWIYLQLVFKIIFITSSICLNIAILFAKSFSNKERNRAQN